MARPSSHSPEQWQQIREEYETTDATVDGLARKHGLKSANSIRRKIQSDGWKRNQEAIAAHVTTRTIGEAAVEEGPPTRSRGPQTIQKNISAHIRAEEARARTPTIDEAGEDVSPPPERAAALETEEQEIATARGVAGHNAKVILQQLRSGEEVEGVGLTVLRAISAYLCASDEDVMPLARRLIGLNPDRETMQGLMLAATNLVKSGTAMKRQALAMDVIAKGAAQSGGEGAAVVPVKGAGARLLGHLSVEAMMKMRQVAAEAARLPPGVLDPIGE